MPPLSHGKDAHLQRLMTNTATLERSTDAAPAQRASARAKDDAAMLKAAANLTRDLNAPSDAIYWADMLGSALLGYAALLGAMFLRPTWLACLIGVSASSPRYWGSSRRVFMAGLQRRPFCPRGGRSRTTAAF